MTLNSRPPLGRAALLALLAVPLAPAHGAEPPAPPAAAPAYAPASPWSFNLELYLWLVGVDGKFSTGRLSRSVDKNFIAIVDASDRVPLGFMGRFEARYEDFGIYLDGNWLNVNLKPKSGPYGYTSAALDSNVGIMDYGVMYRVAGPADLANWSGVASRNRLDVYAGARTIWLDNEISPQRFASVSSSKTMTVPVLGGRIQVDFGRDFFVKADGNFGGFGVANVGFTGGLLGSLGYRTTLFDVPTAIELGYKALRLDVENNAIRAQTTLNGPFLGATAYW